MIIKLNKKYLEAFQGAELGACEDDMRGPSPLTTYEILDRHERNIEIRSAEEAAQIHDTANYGTFRLHASDRIAERVMAEALKFPGSTEIFRKWNHEQWKALGELVSDAAKQEATK